VNLATSPTQAVVFTGNISKLELISDSALNGKGGGNQMTAQAVYHTCSNDPNSQK
jgi:hypothetical protein